MVGKTFNEGCFVVSSHSVSRNVITTDYFKVTCCVLTLTTHKSGVIQIHYNHICTHSSKPME